MIDDEIEIIEEYPILAKKETQSTEVNEEIQGNESEGEHTEKDISNETSSNADAEEQTDVQDVSEFQEETAEIADEIKLHTEQDSGNQDESEIQNEVSDGSNYVRCSKFVRSKAKIGCSSSIANR